MGEEIRSAREIAMEKVEKLGEATEEERLRWKYVPEGEKLAARYLEQEVSLLSELGNYDDRARRSVVEGIQSVLVRNIDLPRNDFIRKANRRAMEGMKLLKKDKVGVENVFSRMRRIFEHYSEQGEQQRQQAYESLKADFEARLQQAMRQQLGAFAGTRVDVERQPQFQEEWRRLQAQLDSQYSRVLDEYKRELVELS